MIRQASRRQRLVASALGLFAGALALPVMVANRLRGRTSGSPRSILVIEIWGLGDVVLATGAIRALRAAHPDAKIHVLAKSYAAPLVIGPEMADGVIAFDFPWTAFAGKYRLSRYRFRATLSLLRSLRAARYDLVVNARADVRNNVLGAFIGGRRFVSAKAGAGDFFATETVALGETDHRSDDWTRVVAVASSSAAPAAPRLAVDARARAEAANALGFPDDGRPVVGIHPGAATAVRRWGLDRFARVADEVAARTGARVVVFAEPDGYGEEMPVGGPVTVVRRSLGEMMALMSRCDLVVCNDSGPMHIACALGVPVVAVFGPGQLEWFGPRGGESRIVRIEDMPCRPCFDACRFAVAHCMTGVSEAMVIDAVLDLLTARRGTQPSLAVAEGRAPAVAAR